MDHVSLPILSDRFHTMTSRLAQQAMSDDVIAYIMVKNGIHECLYDQNAEAIVFCVSQVQRAERLALELQQKNDKQDEETFVLKKYPGVVGGRLRGSESTKLEEKYTRELMFSFKCIVGAMTLSMGTKAMWVIIAQLFDELLELSPEVLRLHFNESTVVQAYYCETKK